MAPDAHHFSCAEPHSASGTEVAATAETPGGAGAFDGVLVLVVTILLFCIVQALGMAVGRMLHWPGDPHRHDDPGSWAAGS